MVVSSTRRGGVERRRHRASAAVDTPHIRGGTQPRQHRVVSLCFPRGRPPTGDRSDRRRCTPRNLNRPNCGVHLTATTHPGVPTSRGGLRREIFRAIATDGSPSCEVFSDGQIDGVTVRFQMYPTKSQSAKLWGTSVRRLSAVDRPVDTPPFRVYSAVALEGDPGVDHTGSTASAHYIRSDMFVD